MRRRRSGPGWRIAAVLVAVAAAAFARAAEPGDAALSRAIEGEDLAALERLLEGGVQVDLPGKGGRTALMIAAKHGREDLVRRLLREGAEVNLRSHNGGTALMFAALGARRSVVDALLSAGAEVNAVGGFDWTPLMIAAVKGDAALVRSLVAHGAEVNRADIYGWTPLMRAAFEQRTEVVRVLLGSPGLDLHARNEVGATALHLAAFGGSADIVDALMAHGSAANVVDDTGRTPAEAAAQGGHSVLATRLAGLHR